MRELVLHIMDIAENGISAGASCIQIRVSEERKQNRLIIEIEDNGKGIPTELLDKITDPFVTSRKTRRVGLGLSLLKSACQRCDGTFSIRSAVGQGTQVTATFRHDHIDRAPLGDIPGSIPLLIISNPHVDFIYTHCIDGREFTIDMREIKKSQDMIDPMMVIQLTEWIKEKILEIDENSRQ